MIDLYETAYGEKPSKILLSRGLFKKISREAAESRFESLGRVGELEVLEFDGVGVLNLDRCITVREE